MADSAHRSQQSAVTPSWQQKSKGCLEGTAAPPPGEEVELQINTCNRVDFSRLNVCVVPFWRLKRLFKVLQHPLLAMGF